MRADLPACNHGLRMVSNLTMPRAVILVLCGMAIGCSSAKVPRPDPAAPARLAAADALVRYLWLAFNCAYVPASQQAVGDWLDMMPVWRETPLVQFKAATCGSMDRGTLEGLLEANPRFREIDYHLALSAARRGRIDEAMRSEEHTS